jgi:hypothetical protein
MSKWVVEPVDGSVAQGCVLNDIENKESSRKRVIPLLVNCFTNVENVESFYNVGNVLPNYTFVKNGSALTVSNIKWETITVIKDHFNPKKIGRRNLFSTILRRVKMTSFIVSRDIGHLASDATNVSKKNVNV